MNYKNTSDCGNSLQSLQEKTQGLTHQCSNKDENIRDQGTRQLHNKKLYKQKYQSRMLHPLQ